MDTTTIHSPIPTKGSLSSTSSDSNQASSSTCQGSSSLGTTSSLQSEQQNQPLPDQESLSSSPSSSSVSLKAQTPIAECVSCLEMTGSQKAPCGHIAVREELLSLLAVFEDMVNSSLNGESNPITDMVKAIRLIDSKTQMDLLCKGSSM